MLRRNRRIVSVLRKLCRAIFDCYFQRIYYIHHFYIYYFVCVFMCVYVNVRLLSLN